MYVYRTAQIRSVGMMVVEGVAEIVEQMPCVKAGSVPAYQVMKTVMDYGIMDVK
jgi:hypothetical protein